MDQLVGIEDVDHHFVAWIRGVVPGKRNFTDKTRRRGIVLFEVAGHRFVDPFWFHELNESELHGVVTVLLFRLLLNDDAGAGLNNGNRNDGSVILQQLRHTDFFA